MAEQPHRPRIELPPDSLVLTPNQAIADSLLRTQLAAGHHPSLVADSVISLSHWLERTLANPLGQPLANELQLLAIWESLIQQQDLPLDLHPPTLAQMALQGWRNLRWWRVESEDLIRAEYGQEFCFEQWCNAFEKHLSALGSTTLELLAEQYLQRPPLTSTKTVLLFGFVEPPAPLWQALIQAWASDLQVMDWPNRAGARYQSRYATPSAEITGAAQWAADQAAARPGKSIGIIATQGEAVRLHLERALLRKGVAARRRQALGSMGPIQGALTLLQLNAPQLNIEDARALVQCPYWGDYLNELSLRARWETQLCRLEIRSLTRSDLKSCLAESPAIVALTARHQHRSEKMSPTQWAAQFQAQLQQLGWPGNRPLTELQNQAVERWPELLSDLASLTLAVPSMTWDEALRWLKKAADGRALAGQHAPIVILDRIEDAVDFDALWLLGADDRDWPPAPAPHPLIPQRLQRQFDMPRSTADRELRLCRRLLDSLAQRSQETYFSFAEDRDNLQCKLTPLLNSPEMAEFTDSQSLAATPVQFEWIDCSSAPPLPPQDGAVKGGHELLRAMAASPFSAFATYRLGAVPLGLPVDGLNPRDRGTLVHELLERIWTHLDGSQAKLLELSEGQREVLVEAEVQQVLRHWKSGWRFGSNQLALIRTRLHNSARDWLQLEVARPPFKVQATERELELGLGPIRLRLRIDRIDRLDAGLLLIDYKSGSSGTLEDWRSSPPRQPQLPLYAIALDQPCAGIAVAKIREGECQWLTLGPGSRLSEAEWESLQRQWREDLTALAIRYAAGETAVYETTTGFFDSDPLERLHRFAEFEDLRQWQLNS